MLDEKIIRERIAELEYGVFCLEKELQQTKSRYPRPDDMDRIYMKDLRRDISNHKNDIGILKWVLNDSTPRTPTDNRQSYETKATHGRTDVKQKGGD